MGNDPKIYLATFEGPISDRDLRFEVTAADGTSLLCSFRVVLGDEAPGDSPEPVWVSLARVDVCRSTND